MVFNLPEQALNTALSSFSEKTGYSILVDEKVMEDRRAHPVHGKFAPREALEKLLTGTGLTVRYSTEYAFSLTMQNEDAMRSAGRTQAAWNQYQELFQSELTAYLCKVQPERFGRYRVLFQMWLDKDGGVEKVEFVESATASRPDVDLSILLAQFSAGMPPPVDMPQPLTILLVPRHEPLMDCPHRFGRRK
ncbi:TonB-dependent outer membrane receptor [Oxalicibacterium flavum]|uniref:TonB-dependent outer membrane receptor n=2 Tax=Oxalicibacterium flavum TaxID=179467 RepID=A0A8J2XWJ3_9BURK|nr:TonB-dependent outer membrane receptor [Oxalicibacterium flavum]